MWFITLVLRKCFLGYLGLWLTPIYEGWSYGRCYVPVVGSRCSKDEVDGRSYKIGLSHKGGMRQGEIALGGRSDLSIRQMPGPLSIHGTALPQVHLGILAGRACNMCITSSLRQAGKGANPRDGGSWSIAIPGTIYGYTWDLNHTNTIYQV